MKKIAIIILILIAPFGAFCQDTTHVLFIGNSITYYNNMPQTFERIANSKGDLTKVTVHAPGGTGFINHVNDPIVQTLFKKGIWDYVVLQPGSNESPGYTETKEQTLVRLKMLKDSILKYTSCAKIVLYEISYGVWGNSPSNLVTYNNTMDLIRANCQFWADSTDVYFAPAGESMRAVWNNDPSVVLWGGFGNIHPNQRGSYLIACSIYSSIFQKPSLGTNEISGLTVQESTKYQELADSVVLKHKPNWRINIKNQFTDFTFSIHQNSVDFVSSSVNIDSLKWTFSDGTVSRKNAITHVFSQAGTYNVSLSTFKKNCMEVKVVPVKISSVVSVNEVPVTNFNIYPNPCRDYFTIESEQVLLGDFSLSSINGQILNSLVTVENQGNRVVVNVSKLPNGVYVFRANQFSKLIYKY